ncbi:hypothetical protein GQ457_14G022360 [Hibiscus cannabinus]
MDMENRMSNMEKAYENIKTDIEDRLDRVQLDTQNYIAKSQEDMLARIAAMLSGNPSEKKGSVIIDPSAIREEHKPSSGKAPMASEAPVMNQQASYPESSLPGVTTYDGPSEYVVPDLNEIEKIRNEFPKLVEDRYKRLEDKVKAMENTKIIPGTDARELSLVPDLVLPPKFKMPEFEKYAGTTCPEAHITMFIRRMTGYIDNDPLLIHCFQDSLTGSAARWYTQLSRTEINSWKDLAHAFIKQYKHVSDIVPDRVTLQNMEKRHDESFRQYAQRWRDVATQVQPPLLEKEIVMLFLGTLKKPFLNRMIGGATKDFSDIIMNGEMIENAIRSGKIEDQEYQKKTNSRRKEGSSSNAAIYNVAYSKPLTVGQPKTTTTASSAHPAQRTDQRKKIETVEFTPIPMTYGELFKNLYDTHIISPFYVSPIQPPYPPWYDPKVKCEYHGGVPGHSIENCTAFKKAVERLIKMGVVKSTILQTPTRYLIMRGRAQACYRQIQNPKNYPEGSCQYHNTKDHDIQHCAAFKALVQQMMSNKELEFFEGNELGKKLTFVPRERKSRNRRAVFPVPWKYDCGIITQEGTQENPVKEVNDTGFFTRSGKRYVPEKIDNPKGKAVAVDQEKPKDDEYPVNEPVSEEQAKEFLKFLKHSDYSVVEHLHKLPARISILSLLLSSEAHRNALMKVLNETFVPSDVSVNKLDRLVNNINAPNYIYFNDDEIPSGGMGTTKALHITTRCKSYTLPGVLIDNGSALNVLPLATMERLPIDSSHMKACNNTVRAFDGTERKVIGKIEVPLIIGPNTYEIDFIVMDIRPTYNCLLGRPWIHAAGAVPSSLHQKLKFILDGQLVTVNAEEEIIASVTTDAPYIEVDEKAVECSFRSLEFVNATFVAEGNRLRIPRLPDATKMGVKLTVGKGARAVEKKEEEKLQDMMEALDINVIFEEEKSEIYLRGICPYAPGSVLNNWTAEALPTVFRSASESLDITVSSDAEINSEPAVELEVCLDEPGDYEERFFAIGFPNKFSGSEGIGFGGKAAVVCHAIQKLDVENQEPSVSTLLVNIDSEFGPYGQEIVAGDDIHGDSNRLLSRVTPKSGVLVKQVNTSDLDEIAAVIGPKTMLVWLESPTSPRLQIADIQIAHANGAFVLVDNSIMSPVLSRPLELGVDIVMHSATKFIAGHSDVMVGVLAVKEERNLNHKGVLRRRLLEKQNVSSKVYFMKQIVGNACGITGLLHSVGNVTSEIKLPATQYSPTSRGIYLREATACQQSTEWTVQVEPKFHDDASKLEEMVPFEECIELRSSLWSWIRTKLGFASDDVKFEEQDSGSLMCPCHAESTRPAAFF